MSALDNTIRRVRFKAKAHGYGYIVQKGYAHMLNLIVGPLTRHLLKAEYRAQRADSLGPNERPLEYSAALQALAFSPDQDVLDVGPGISPWPALVANCGYHVTAIDEMSEYWGGRVTNRHFHVVHDNVLAPTTKAKFGTITCISTLEHIPDHQGAVVAMSKMLRENGILILSFPYNEHHYVGNAYELPEARHYAEHVNYICQVYSRENVNQWCEESGLSLELQRYFQVFSGAYWGCGERLRPSREVSVSDPHHLTVLVLRKSVVAQTLSA